MQGFQYAVDIVLCIDATGSMGPVIERVKSEALKFNDDLQRALELKSKHVDQLRVKVIEFRDFYDDAASAVRQSEFLELPRQIGEFNTFVSGIKATGGGDAPESGLEALALAIKSDWTKAGEKRRHAIVVWTDTSAHPLDMNAGSKPDGYPQGIPSNFDDLTDAWSGQMGMNQSAQRLVLFTPDASGWSEIRAYWDNVVHFPSQAGKGLEDVEYSAIIDTIAQSV